MIENDQLPIKINFTAKGSGAEGVDLLSQMFAQTKILHLKCFQWKIFWRKIFMLKIAFFSKSVYSALHFIINFWLVIKIFHTKFC